MPLQPYRATSVEGLVNKCLFTPYYRHTIVNLVFFTLTTPIDIPSSGAETFVWQDYHGPLLACLPKSTQCDHLFQGLQRPEANPV